MSDADQMKPDGNAGEPPPTPWDERAGFSVVVGGRWSETDHRVALCRSAATSSCSKGPSSGFLVDDEAEYDVQARHHRGRWSRRSAGTEAVHGRGRGRCRHRRSAARRGKRTKETGLALDYRAAGAPGIPQVRPPRPRSPSLPCRCGHGATEMWTCLSKSGCSASTTHTGAQPPAYCGTGTARMRSLAPASPNRGQICRLCPSPRR